MRLIDTHCHVDLYPDYPAVLDEIERGGIYTIAVTNAPSVFRRCVEMTRATRSVRVAVGLHPELAAARERELDLLQDLLPTTRYVGEVGLDYVSCSPYRVPIARLAAAQAALQASGTGGQEPGVKAQASDT